METQDMDEDIRIVITSQVGFWRRLWVTVSAVPSYLFRGHVDIL